MTQPLGDALNGAGGGRRSWFVHNRGKTCATLCLERLRKCADRSLPVALQLADLLSASLSRSSRLNLWQHSSQIAAICRAAFPS